MKVRPLHRILAGCFALALNATLSAQIRDYVAIVRPSLHAETISWLEKLSGSLRQDGYVNLPDALDGYIKGGFGSGFVYVTPDGKNYIVTNRHVIAGAKSAKVEFEKADGTLLSYDNLDILAEDAHLDLAVLSFPPDLRPFAQGLSMETAPREDGDEIWSAGFPGFGNVPMWQLGKGTITNARARVPELADTDLTTLIQHSAQVDPGNSGGPLLISAKKAVGGYSVVGINTWKALNRQATNYSIPSATIKRFLDFALSPEPSDDEGAVKNRLSEFALTGSAKKTAYISMSKFISYGAVGTSGPSALKDVLSRSPSVVRDQVISEFVNYSPVEAMRYAIAYAIQTQLADASGDIAITVDGVSKNNDSYITEITTGSGVWSCSWVKERGVWFISSFSSKKNSASPGAKPASAFESRKKEQKTDLSIESPYTVLLSGIYSFAVSGNGSGPFGGQLLLSANDFVDVGINILGQRLSDVSVVDNGSSLYEKTSETTTMKIIMMNGLARVRIPFVFSAFSILPYAQVDAGYGGAKLESDFCICYGMGLGGGVLVGLGASQRFFLDAGYRYEMINIISNMESSFKSDPRSSIMIAAGVGF